MSVMQRSALISRVLLETLGSFLQSPVVARLMGEAPGV